MEPKLSVVVRVDLDAHQVRIVVTGHLTGLNQQGLHPLMRRASTLTPGLRMVVDCSAAVLTDPAVLDLLREAAHGTAAGPQGEVEFLFPTPDLEQSMTGGAQPVGADQPTRPAPTRRAAA